MSNKFKELEEEAREDVSEFHCKMKKHMESAALLELEALRQDLME